jgi:hypothetical protein
MVGVNYFVTIYLFEKFPVVIELKVYQFLKLASMCQPNYKLTSTTYITMLNFNIIPSFTFCLPRELSHGVF